MIGVDPAAASLDVARGKSGAEQVTWILGDVTDLPELQVDLAVMTANTAQAIVDSSSWKETLSGSYAALRPGGYLAFETRDPARRAWEEWNREASWQETTVPGVGRIERWIDLLDVSGPLVSFRWTWVFASDGTTLTSDSMLRFRSREEVEADLRVCGYAVQEVHEAPDRPGRELVFVARR